MIALAPNERLHKLSRTGTVLADFATMVSDGAPKAGPVDKFGGPFEPEISPDGKLVAFEWFNDSYSDGGSNCSSSSVPPCYVLSSRSGVGITHADRLTGPEEFGLLTGWIYPHWMSDDKLLRSSPGAILNENTVFNTIGPGKADKEMKRWFFDANGGQDVFDVELSSDLKTVVGIVGQGSDHLRVYRPLFDPYSAPAQKLGPFDTNTPVVEPCYEFNDPVGGKFESSSLSPDGRRLAYGVGNGIWVASLPDLSGGCQLGSDAGKLMIPGGRFAHWGPAGIPPKSAYGGLQLSVAGVSLGKALSKGLPLTVGVPGKGRLSASASYQGKRVASGGPCGQEGRRGDPEAAHRAQDGPEGSALGPAEGVGGVHVGRRRQGQARRLGGDAQALVRLLRLAGRTRFGSPRCLPKRGGRGHRRVLREDMTADGRARGSPSRRDDARGRRDRQRGQHPAAARRRRGGSDRARRRPGAAARV